MQYFGRIKKHVHMLDDVERVPYYHWVKEYYHKELTESSGSDIKKILLETFTELKSHFYWKRVQSKAYKVSLQNLGDDEMVIHVDYSENYKNRQQNEIKSAFYGQGQFTLYTACIYAKFDEKVVCKSFALVTLENDHSCNVSFALKKFLVEEAFQYKTCRVVKF